MPAEENPKLELPVLGRVVDGGRVVWYSQAASGTAQDPSPCGGNARPVIATALGMVAILPSTKGLIACLVTA